MDFNISKCKILQITTHHIKSVFAYKMPSTIATVFEHNYLGIRLHYKLSWDPHVNYICNKTNQLLGFLKRNLYNAPSSEIKEHVYKQLVLPSIEYCSTIWDPYHHTSIYKLEMIQHHAARFVLNKPWHRSNQQLDITDMLTYLKWPSP